MADKQSRLTEIYKAEKSKGGGIASTLGKRTLEKVDPRQFFNQKGFMATALPSLFKSYSATPAKSGGKVSSMGGSFSTGVLETKLDILTGETRELKIHSKIAAKNSESLPLMARDMNLMRQNITKLVKLQGGTTASRADMFFKKSGEKESAYESKFKKEGGKTSPTSAATTTGGKPEGFLSGLMGGLGKGLGLASIGVGIAGFLTALGGAAYVLNQVGGAAGLKDLMVNLAEGLSAFSGQSLLTLGALLGTGMLFGAVTGVKTKFGAALGMTTIGLGIGGFFAGLSAGGALSEFIGGSSGVRDMMVNLAEGLNAFSSSSLIALGSLLAAGAIFGATGLAGPAALGIGAIGAGIGAFLLALSGSAAVIDLFGGGSSLKDLLVNLAEGLGAFSSSSLIALGSLLAAGAIFGATGLAGPAAIGIGTIGVGIGAFLIALSGSAAVIDLFGGGPKLKDLLVNLAEGLGAFSNIDADNLSKIAGVLPTFGASMLAFFGAAGIGGIVQSLAGGVKGLIDFIFGDGKKSPMQKLSEDLNLLQNINGDNLSKIGQGMKDLASGMLGLAKLTDEDLAKVNKAAAVAGATQPPSTATSSPGTKYNPAADSQAANTPAPTSTSAPQPISTSPTKSSTTPITTGPGGAAYGMYPKPGGIQSDLMAAFAQEGITDEKTQIALLANIKKESGFKPISENLNYTSTARLKEVFPSRTKNLSDEELKKYTNNPQGLAELVYGGKMGNTEPGDGFKYRGRGFIQLTGKNNYASMGAALNLPLVDNPDLANDPVVAARIAARYIKDAKLRKSFATQEEANRAVTQSIGGRNLNLDSGYGATLLTKVNSYAGDISLASSGTSSPNQSAALTPNAPSSPGLTMPSVVASAATPASSPNFKMPTLGTLAAAAPNMGATIASATSTFTDALRMFDSALASITNITNNNTQTTAAAQQSQGNPASVYDDVFLNLFQRVT